MPINGIEVVFGGVAPAVADSRLASRWNGFALNWDEVEDLGRPLTICFLVKFCTYRRCRRSVSPVRGPKPPFDTGVLTDSQ